MALIKSGARQARDKPRGRDTRSVGRISAATARRILSATGYTAPQSAAPPAPTVTGPAAAEAFREAVRANAVAPPTVNYHRIITLAISNLTVNSVETRHAVYECARQVVVHQLVANDSPLPKELAELEMLSLDLVIRRIEAAQPTVKADTKQSASSEPAMPVHAIATTIEEPIEQPVPVPPAPPPGADIQHVRGFHAGSMRLFGVGGLIAILAIGAWAVMHRAQLSDLIRAPQEQTSSETAPHDDEAAVTQTSGAQPEVIPSELNTTPTETASIKPPPAEGETTIDTAAAPAQDSPQDLPGSPVSRAPAWPSDRGTTEAQPATDETQTRAPRRAVAPAPPARSKVAVADAANDTGVAAMEANDLEAAVKSFSDAIRLDPKFATAYVNRGQAQFKSGDTTAAVADFTTAIRIDGSDPMAYRLRGMAVLYTGDEAKALADLGRAIELALANPARMPALDLFYSYRSHAALLDKRQQFDRELGDLSAMIDAYADDATLADGLKASYGAAGVNGLIATVYRSRGGIYARQQHYDLAVADLSFALQLDPTRAYPALIERARIYEVTGRRNDARTDFQRALLANPNSSEAKAALLRLRG